MHSTVHSLRNNWLHTSVLLLWAFSKYANQTVELEITSNGGADNADILEHDNENNGVRGLCSQPAQRFLNSSCRVVSVVESGTVGTTALADEENRREKSAKYAAGGHQAAPVETWSWSGGTRITQLHVVLSHLESHEESDWRSDEHRWQHITRLIKTSTKDTMDAEGSARNSCNSCHCTHAEPEQRACFG